MKIHCLMTTALAALMIIGLAGCEKKEERGVQRIEGLETPATATAPAGDMSGAAAPSAATQAPPLSELANASHDHAHDANTSAAPGSDMVVQAGQTRVMAGGNILQVAGLAFTVSEDWKNVKPDNAVRVAEYELDGAGGPAEMAVFYFGKNQGGGLEDNIRRWAGQFTADPSTTSTGGAQVGRIEKGDLRIALVKTEGTYNPGSMGPAMAATGPKEDYALFGLVVEGGPEGSVFIKVTGPKATIQEQSEALEAMAQSVRVSEYK